ncbi:MAG: hypothetical protein HQK62_12165 [Desulfamplus sp.]|nr:hypothetical protein [Desulfamplus sp.]
MRNRNRMALLRGSTYWSQKDIDRWYHKIVIVWSQMIGIMEPGKNLNDIKNT